ncbi:MAG: hypothetical protein H7Z11_19045 [Verrucomicrobia bacterium]|nr:hypothetical protein [Leptolyngbya sp. ES-bin-22]
MSNSFSPKKAPNLNQETLERVLVTLRQPFSIAVLASLGLHGVLWAALPNMLADTEKVPDTQRRVQTVELSPAEQSQLPSFGINQVPTLLPTNPTKPAQSGTKLPDPKLYNDPSLYNFPLLQPPPPIVFPSFGLPPIGFDFNQLPAKKPPKPAPKPITPPKPPADPGTTTKTDQDPPKPTVDPNAPVRPEKLSPEQLTALRQEGARSRELRTLYTFNGADTKEKASGVFNANADAFIDLAKKVTDGNVDDSRLYKTPERVNGLFPKDACPFVRGFRNASFGAIVKPDGTLAEPPIVLLPSGYRGLDTAAIEDITSTIKTKKFGDGSKFQLIRFDYIFDPQPACPKPSKSS